MSLEEERIDQQMCEDRNWKFCVVVESCCAFLHRCATFISIESMIEG